MSNNFEKGDNALFVTPHGLTPVIVISTTGENLQPPYRDKYPIAAVSSAGDVYNFTSEGRMNVTDALPRLFHAKSSPASDQAPAPKVETSFILSEVIKDLKQREERGLKKYGTTVDRGDLSIEEWMQHFYEELLDGAVYARKILQDMPE